jgi:hypothetical protein
MGEVNEVKGEQPVGGIVERGVLLLVEGRRSKTRFGGAGRHRGGAAHGGGGGRLGEAGRQAVSNFRAPGELSS